MIGHHGPLHFGIRLRVKGKEAKGAAISNLRGVDTLGSAVSLLQVWATNHRGRRGGGGG